MPRTTGFDAERGRLARDLAERGETRQAIADRLGVSRRTLQGWLRRGREGHPTYAAWVADFYAASSQGHRRRIVASSEVDRARGRERWRAFRASREAWWLAR